MLEPYQDELLIGLIARYHAYSGQNSFRDNVRALFDLEGVRPSIHLPSHILRLSINGPFGKSADELISDHTLYPYYQSFLNPAVAKQVRDEMLQGKNSGIPLMAGLVPSIVSIPSQMVCCPACIRSDIERYGEPYWHRVHHIPGVMVCPEHRVRLYTRCPSCDTAIYDGSIQEFPYPVTMCPKGHSLVHPQLNDDPLLITLAQDSEFLLNNNAPWNTLGELQTRYVNELFRMQLATPSGSVRQTELHELFIRHFGERFWAEIGVPAPLRDKQWTWLRQLTRKPRGSLHPLFHLLLMEFLSTDVPTFFACSPFLPFGHSPWPCLNKAANHYMQNVVEDLTVTLCSDTRRPVGTFHCDCGFVYSRRGPDLSEEARHHYGRIKQFGDVWVSKLRELVSGSEWSYRGVSRELGTDPKVIDAQLKKVGLSERQDRSSVLLECQIRRNRFMKVLMGHPGLSRTELKRVSYGDYTWLYRHDREWLNAKLPCYRVPQSGYPRRVDWAKRDQEMADEVEHIARAILRKSGKPVRVTVSRVGRICGKLPLLEKYRQKLPKTARVLDTYVETDTEFRSRRIHWAIVELEQDLSDIALWRIVRKAGLKTPVSQDVARQVSEILRQRGHMRRIDRNVDEPSKPLP